MQIEPLTSRHDRSLFDCGVESLNEYLQRYARQNAKRDLGITYVAVDKAEATRVDGYYTIVSSSLERKTVPETSLPSYPVPTLLVARLAIDKNRQGQGWGGLLLIDSLRRASKMAQELGIYAVEVVAKDEAARRFYQRYGFVALFDDPFHLYLSLKTVRAMDI